MTISSEALDMAARVEAFVRGTIFPYEQDPRAPKIAAVVDAHSDHYPKSAFGIV